MGPAGWSTLINAMYKIRILGHRTGSLRYRHRRLYLCASDPSHCAAPAANEAEGSDSEHLSNGSPVCFLPLSLKIVTKTPFRGILASVFSEVYRVELLTNRDDTLWVQSQQLICV